MAIAETTVRAESLAPAVQWSAIIAGAVAAAGVSFTLLAFGSAIGLAVVSTAPTWRDSTGWLWFLSGLYLVFVALVSFGLGGYIAGRMRAPTRLAVTPETEFRDGIHGILTWGLAVLISGFLAAMTAAALAPSALSAGHSGTTAAATGESIVASELDQLFRTPRTVNNGDMTYRRAEATRILLKSSSHDTGISQADRTYLTALVAYRAGIPDDEAEARTARAIAEAKQDIANARAAAVLQAFMVGAALLLGAAVAWFAAAEGGRDREMGTIPIWDWRFSRRVHT